MNQSKYFLLIIVFCSLNLVAFSQEKQTISLSLVEVQDLFVKNNLSLIATKYNIDIAKANVIQSKLFNNPNVSYNQELYSPTYHSVLNPIKQFSVQVSQLFSIAGKYKNNIKLNEIATELTETNFKDLLRTLNFAVNQTYIGLMIAQQKQKMYDLQITSINKLIDATKTELRIGAVPKNDLIRLQTERQNLQNNITGIESQINDFESQLNILISSKNTSYIITQSPALPIDVPSIENILLATKENRPDLIFSNQQIKYQEQNIKLQKSMAVPDMAINTAYDRAAAFGNNFFSVGAAMDLPVFNKNQGNIKIAQYQLQQANANKNSIENVIEQEVYGAYQNVLLNKKQLSLISDEYKKNLEELIQFATENYSKHYISLLEYLDQLRTYTNAQNDLIDLSSSYLNSIATLNYKTGINIIK